MRDYRYAAESIAVTTLRSVIGDISLDDVLARREQVNHVMQAKLDEVTERWGVKINAVEIQRDPAAARNPGGDEPPDVGRAEPPRRGHRGRGHTRGGHPDRQRRPAGRRPQRRRPEAGRHPQAEGDRQAAILNAEGFSMALDRIYGVASRIDERTMGLQYLDMMRSLAGSPSTKWIVPAELTTFVQGFARNLMAASARRRRPTARPPAPQPAPPAAEST